MTVVRLDIEISLELAGGHLQFVEGGTRRRAERHKIKILDDDFDFIVIGGRVGSVLSVERTSVWSPSHNPARK